MKGSTRLYVSDMEKREFSLENFISHAHKVVDEVASLEETHQHYVCEDPKHDVLLLLLTIKFLLITC